MSRIPTGRRSRRLMAALAVTAVAVPALLAGVTAAPAMAAPATPAVGTLVSANPDDTVPHALNGAVYAFAEIGDTVYVGGSFTAIRTAANNVRVARSYLFAYDRATGVLRADFLPVLDGTVQALTVSPDGKLIVGGAFRTVNGVARRNLVELNPVTGATVTAWVGRGDGGLVRKLVVRGNLLYVAGAFHYINGTRHSLLARLNATTGAIDPTFTIDAAGARTTTSAELVWGMDVSPDGSTLVAVGNFSRVNGMTRHQVVMVETAGTPRVVSDWATQRFAAPCAIQEFPFYARDVDFSDDGSYFAIGADGASQDGAYCDMVTRWETGARGTNLNATWIADTGNDSVTSVEATDNLIYAGGHFRWMNNSNALLAGDGAVDRYGYAALNPINGMPVAWNPTRSGAPAGTTAWGPVVFELWKGRTGLWAGYDSDGLGREYHGRMGMFPLAGGRTVPALNAPNATSGFLYLGGTAGKLTKVPFNGTALGTPVVTNQPAVVAPLASFSVGNRLYYVRSDAAAGARGRVEVSTFANGSAGTSRVGSGFNTWFNAAGMTGAFYLDGRMYYTVANDPNLYYRFLEPDGSIVGCTRFTVPSTGVAWGLVRGLAYVGGKIVFGATDGALRAMPFTTDGSVNGATAVTLASATPTARWSHPALFFATS